MNKNQPIQVKDIISFLGPEVISIDGEYEDKFVDNLADVEHVNESTLDWIKVSPNSQIYAERSKAQTLIVGPEVDISESIRSKNKILIHVKNPKLALAIVGNRFFVDTPNPSIHPSSIIDKDAIIGQNVFIGPYCVIGKAKIGDNCIIESNVRIFDNVTIGYYSKIGPGVIIGGEGFGFETDNDGNLFRFPQIGSVKIGHHVEIGANTCIDRGALSETIIGNHTKINNLCHIAHNNIIGNNVIITGCVNISGSNIIEDKVWIAPNASIRGFLHLHKACIIGMGAVVTKDVPEGETWIGNPAHKKFTI